MKASNVSSPIANFFLLIASYVAVTRLWGPLSIDMSILNRAARPEVVLAIIGATAIMALFAKARIRVAAKRI